MTREEFAAVMVYIGHGCGKVLSNDGMLVYFDLLRDLPLEPLQLAAQRALLESTYPVFPPVGSLRQLAVEAMRPRALTALEAWGLVLKAVETSRRENPFGSQQAPLQGLPEPVFRIASCIGWRQLRNSASPDTIRAHFLKAYEAEQESERREELLPEAMRGQLAALGHQKRNLLEGPDDSESDHHQRMIETTLRRRKEFEEQKESVRREVQKERQERQAQEGIHAGDN